MKSLILLLLSCACASAQTTVYARASGPRGFKVGGVVNGTPPTITSTTPHGLVANDRVGLFGICTGTALQPAAGRSPVNGIFIVASTPTPTTFTINDLSNTPIVGNGNSVICSSLQFFPDSSPYGGKVTGFTLPSGAVGWLDGNTGPITRKLALGTGNGLTSLVVSSNVATVTTSYNHGMDETITNKISVTGSGNTALDTANGTGAYSPYTVTVVDATHFTFPTSGVSNGTYSNANNACGPAATPNDTIGGTQDCLRISQLAYTGNPFWDVIIQFTDYTVGGTKPNNYKFTQDGGQNFQSDTSETYGYYFGQGAFRFMVDQSNTTLATALAYFMNNMEKVAGVNIACNSQSVGCGTITFIGDGDEWFTGLSESASVFAPYMSSAHLQTFWDKVYNDVDDVTRSASSTVDAEMGFDAPNKVLNSGQVAAGTNDATHVSLASGASGTNNFYVNNVVGFKYITTISSIVAGSNYYTVTTTTPWGFAARQGEFQVYLTGITGTGTCANMNTEWQVTNGLDVIDTTHFIIHFSPIGCTSPTGGTSTSWQACRTGAITPCYGQITAYDGTTKIATVAGGFNRDAGPMPVNPSPDMTYYVFATASMNTYVITDLVIDGTTNTKCTSALKPFSSINVGDSLNVVGGSGFSTPQVVQIVSVTGVTATVSSSLGNLGSTGGIAILGGPRGSATVTGYNTHFTTDISVGDGIFAANGWDYMGGYIMQAESYVTSITDDTHLKVINSYGPISTATPSLAWYLPKWKSGDVGYAWLTKAWIAAPGAQPVLYPTNGGGAVGYGYGVAAASNNGIKDSFGHFALGLAAAPTERRGIRDGLRHQMYGFDYEFQHYMTYGGSPLHSGATYSNGNVFGIGFVSHSYIDSLPGFPAFDTTFFRNGPMWKIFSVYPDMRSFSTPLFGTPMGFGTETGDSAIYPGASQALAYLIDPIFAFLPASNEAKWLRYFDENSTGLNVWSGGVANISYYAPLALIHNDPRQQSASYTGIPLQYAFLKTSHASCATVTGWPCPSSLSGNSFLSRTSWTDRTSSLVFAGFRSFFNDHDQPQQGATWIYKVGGLVNSDVPPGLFSSVNDLTTMGDMLRVGGAANVMQGAAVQLRGYPAAGNSPVTQWASSNHGTWDSQFGDQASKYAFMCADLTGVYTYPMDYATRCVGHLKDLALNSSTGEEIVFQWNSVSLASNPTQIETHVHYVQNGQPEYDAASSGFYSEGNTTCPGSGGCANLDTNRTIQSMENGLGPVTAGISSMSSVGGATNFVTATPHGIIVGDFTHYATVSGVTGTGTCNGQGLVNTVSDPTHVQLQINTSTCTSPSGGTTVSEVNPARTYGVISKFLSPGTITLRDDAMAFPTISSVAKMAAVNITTLTPGNPTQILTASVHNVVLHEYVTVSGVTGTGNCNGAGVVTAVPDSTHYSVQYNSTGCTSPTGGTSNTPTLFNAPGQNLYTAAAITSISIANPGVITTSSAHNLAVGQFVNIFGVTSTGGSCDSINNSAINDARQVTSIPTSTTFTVGYSTLGCTSPTGGISITNYYNQVTILNATGDWLNLNTSGHVSNGVFSTSYMAWSVPWVIRPIDANTFTLFDSRDSGTHALPDTSAYSGTFNGTVNGVYVGGNGFSHRVSVCGGSPCGSTVSSFEALVVHKISKNLSDTTLTLAALNPDANWTGFQSADKVVLVNRGNALHSAITGFTTTHSGTAQYLFSGLLPGSYAITIGGSAVTGSPFIVTSSNDATIHFESTAGAVVVAGTPSGFGITTSSLPSATTGSAYSQTLATSGGTGSVHWDTVSGTICAGLTLNSSTGVVAGTPTDAGACPMLFSATDSSSPTITVNRALSMNALTEPTLVLTPPSLAFTCAHGGSDPATQTTAIGALRSEEHTSELQSP